MALRASDERFLAFLKRLGGLSRDFLDESDLVELMLPILRSDFRALESLSYVSPLVISANIAACSGREDIAARPALMQAWSDQTAGRFQAQDFAGGHFYLDESRAPLMETLAPILKEVASGT